MIRAKFHQKWQDKWYDKDEPMQGTKRQETALVDCGRAYVKTEEFPAHDKLKEAGYQAAEDIRKATDEDLLDIDGIGPATLEKIRTYTNEDKGCGCND